MVDLIELGINCWKQDLIMTTFHSEDAEAICRIPLSRRRVVDSIIWLRNRNGRYFVKSGYYVARQVLRSENWAKCSRGNDKQKVLKALWKMKVLNKIKIFGWRACHGILPTRLNLAKCNIIAETVCPIRLQSPEMTCTYYGIVLLHKTCGVEVGLSCRNAHLDSKMCYSYLTI